MSYIGVPPVSGDFVVLDAITTSATASYTLQRNSANFVPESANHMLVSLNGTIQKPNSSFTISGSTITFSSALTSSDAIDFILVLGNVNAVGVATTVSDNAITNAKTDFVSTSSAAGLQIKGDGTTDGTLQLNCSQNSHGIKLRSPAHSSSSSYTLTFPTTDPSADKFLKTDGSGNLSFADAGGGTPNFHAYRSADWSSVPNSSWAKVPVNVEEFDSDSAYDHSTNYRFTPQKAGLYFMYGSVNNGTGLTTHYTSIYKNGSAHRTAQADAGSGSVINVSGLIDFNGSSDYVELYTYMQGTASATMGQFRTFFGGFFVT
jgi:hypothetical protein